ncbi:MAG: hypothetical protein ACOCV2_04650 [Persicimonas sp.]
MNEQDDNPLSIAWRLIAVGLVAALAGWGVNALLVEALQRHEPSASEGVSLPKFDLKALLDGGSSGSGDQEDLEALFAESDRTDGGQSGPPPTLSEDAVTLHEPAPRGDTSDGSKEPRGEKPERAETTPANEDESEKSEPDKPAGSEKPDRAPTPEKAVEEEPVEEDGGDGSQIYVFSVDEKAISKQVDSVDELAQHGRIVPHYVDGKRAGMRIVDIAQGGVFDRLGVEDGDAVRSVNGKTINTQYNALDAIDKMRDERRFDVILERDGQRRHHRYLVN